MAVKTRKLIERAKHEWGSTADSLPQLICLLDPHGTVIRANMTVERWSLASVLEVKGESVHKLLHPTCSDAPCYLATLFNHAWQELRQGNSFRYEIYDEHLERFLRFLLQPIIARPEKGTENQSSFAVIIVDDITESKQAEVELQRSNAELQCRNRELDAFAHTVAHDIKNPLNLILGFTELLTDGLNSEPSPNDLWLEYVQTIAQSGRKMSRIINELLLMSDMRRESSAGLVPLDMGSLVQQAKSRIADLIKAHQASIVEPECWPSAWGDIAWIEEVWINFLTVAINYGGSSPSLELGTSEEAAGMIRFWVRNTGPALSQSVQTQLFSPAESGHHDRARGHGLGLPIARQLIEKLGGKVGLEPDRRFGQGNLFFFTLPSKAPKR